MASKNERELKVCAMSGHNHTLKNSKVQFLGGSMTK